MTSTSAFKYLISIALLIAITWRLIRSSQNDLDLPLKSALIAGLIRLGALVLTISLVVLPSLLSQLLLPNSRALTLCFFIVSMILGVYVAEKADKLARALCRRILK